MQTDSSSKIQKKENEISLNGVLNSMQDAYIIIIDIEGKVLLLNKQAQKDSFLDYPLHVGSIIYDVIPQQKHGSIKMMIANLCETGEPFRTSLEKVTNGVKVHFDVRYSPVKNEYGKVSQILVEGRDVTGEKIFANKIKRVTGDFTNLVENANALIIGTDSSGYITDWNARCTIVTGYDKQEMYARKFSEFLIDNHSIENFHSLFESLLKGKLLTNYELTIISKDGQKRILLVNGTPRKNVEGKIDGVMFVGQDVTELIAYRISLEERVVERTQELNMSNLEIRKQKDEIEFEREKSDQLLLNILPEFVAKELKEEGHVIPRYFKSATILFADLVGFTNLCKGLSPEQILYELNYIFVGFDYILEKHGLEKIKTIGDGYMAGGGLPIPNDTHPSDAVKAGLEMIAYVNRVSKENKSTARPPWQAKVGIHTGELTAGVIGKSKFAYDVWGRSVNTANRMESTCEGGKVNVSGATYELIKNEFDCVHRGAIKVKNMGELQMYYVNKPR